jgi:AraC-like DNA-binding protein
MENQITRYQVQSPVLRNYIKFFWMLRIDKAQLNHRLIPQRNINLRINLSDTPHYVSINTQKNRLEDVYFLGLQTRFTNSHLKLDGNVNILGICFKEYGVYPFLKIPVSEYKNQIVGADEIGFRAAKKISERLKEASDTENRLAIIESELLSLLDHSHVVPDRFHSIFNALKQEKSLQLTEFCKKNNISIRQLERMYIKYVGLPATSYNALNRFHSSVNQLLDNRFSKFSDLAYDNEYYDQMHFIREFKRFTGYTPKMFVSQNNSILQIGKMG